MIQPTLPSTVLIIVVVMMLFVTIPRPTTPSYLNPRLVVALPTIDNGEGVFIREFSLFSHAIVPMRDWLDLGSMKDMQWND